MGRGGQGRGGTPKGNRPIPLPSTTGRVQRYQRDSRRGAGSVGVTRLGGVGTGVGTVSEGWRVSGGGFQQEQSQSPVLHGHRTPSLLESAWRVARAMVMHNKEPARVLAPAANAGVHGIGSPESVESGVKSERRRLMRPRGREVSWAVGGGPGGRHQRYRSLHVERVPVLPRRWHLERGSQVGGLPSV